MDIQLSLKKILGKYKIKTNGETYQDTINAKVRNILLNIANTNNKISIRGAGEHTRQLLQLVPELDIEYIFDRSAENGQTCIINSKEYKLLTNDYIKSIDCIIVSSFAHRIKMSYEIKKINSNIKIIDIYKILNSEGYCVNEPFYKITDESYESFIFYKNRFEENNTAINLKAVIKSCIDICDFIYFEKYCDLYIKNKYEGYEDVFNAEIEIQNILQKTKETLKLRKTKDIIMVWNDQVGYSELKKMNYLNNLSEKSLLFENAYTMTPFTVPVFREMFQNIKSLDDNIYINNYPEIGYDNSQFIKKLEDSGYEFIYIGDEGDGNLFEPQYVVKTYTYGSSNVRALEMIQKLIDSDRPLFILLHALVEVHNPYLSADLSKPMWYEWPYFQGEKQDKVDIQSDISLKYWDRQLEYYMSFIGENAIKIFMSDHGKRFGIMPIYLEQTTHVFCFVKGKNIPNIRYTKLFSLIDFIKLIKAILSMDFKQDNICSDMVFLQETAVFNETAINYYIENDALEASMAFRAVRTENELFVRISDGTEHYYIEKDEVNDKISDIHYEKRINHLRKYVSNDFEKAALNQKMLEKFRSKYEMHE